MLCEFNCCQPGNYLTGNYRLMVQTYSRYTIYTMEYTSLTWSNSLAYPWWYRPIVDTLSTLWNTPAWHYLILLSLMVQTCSRYTIYTMEYTSFTWYNYLAYPWWYRPIADTLSTLWNTPVWHDLILLSLMVQTYSRYTIYTMEYTSNKLFTPRQCLFVT